MVFPEPPGRCRSDRAQSKMHLRCFDDDAVIYSSRTDSSEGETLD